MIETEKTPVFSHPLLDGASSLGTVISSEISELSNYVKNKNLTLLDRVESYEDIINIDKYSDHGFSFLVGITYKVQKFRVGIRYIRGITSLSTSHNKDDYSMLYQAYISYDLFEWIEDNSTKGN